MTKSLSIWLLLQAEEAWPGTVLNHGSIAGSEHEHKLCFHHQDIRLAFLYLCIKKGKLCFRCWNQVFIHFSSTLWFWNFKGIFKSTNIPCIEVMKTVIHSFQYKVNKYNKKYWLSSRKPTVLQFFWRLSWSSCSHYTFHICSHFIYIQAKGNSIFHFGPKFLFDDLQVCIAKR